MSPEELKAEHRRSSYHRAELVSDSGAACFHCLDAYPSTRIERWTDGGNTALCPSCGIDAVLPVTPEHPVSAERLQTVRAYWFGA